LGLRELGVSPSSFFGWRILSFLVVMGLPKEIGVPAMVQQFQQQKSDCK